MTIKLCMQILYIVGYVLVLSTSPTTSKTACRFNEFRCSDGSGCLSTEKLCNGHRDCRSGEEERGVWCQQTVLSAECKAGEFRCRFGGCIPENKKCDAVFDCRGGTDEATDLCPHKPKQSQQAPPTRKDPPHFISGTNKVQQESRPRPTNSLQTTRATVPPPALFSIASSSLGGSACPILALESGQTASCYKQGSSYDINCLEETAPIGTIADITCEQFYVSTGGQKTRKTCQNGEWKGGQGQRRFWCELDCGRGGYKPVGFVAGGTTSIKGKWPWHVGLYEVDIGIRKFKNICGATLISKRAVVTAAHCVTYPQTNKVKDIRRLKLFLGKFYRDVDKNDEDVQIMKPTKIVVHERYSYQNLDADIAVIFLDKDSQISPFVHPICLPEDIDNEAPVNLHGTLVGWGSIGNRIYPDLLQEASLPVVSHQKCRASHQALSVLAKADTFCAGYANGSSACDGDSGSGLVFPHSTVRDKWTIRGIVSGGVPLAGAAGCDPYHYVAFTNVAKYRDWIDKTLDEAPFDF